jgi:hypothetical protein
MRKTTMKKLVILFAGSLFSVGALADNFAGNPDLYGSILNDHGRGAPSVPAQPGDGDLYGSVLLEGPPHVHKCLVAQPGKGDLYGSILIDTERKGFC